MTKKIEFTTEEAQKGQRLDKIVSSNCKDISRNNVQKLIANNHLTIDGRIVTDCSYQVKPYEHILMIIEEGVGKSKYNTLGKEMPLNIIYEDEYLLILNKQAGLTVHPGAGNHNDTLVNGLVHYLGNKLSSINGSERPGIVHRLDRDTTGLMIIAKTDECHFKLGHMIQEKLIQREYIAFVYGVPHPKVGRIEANIGRNPALRTTMRIVRESGKHAVTNYILEEILAYGTVSKVRCKLETGRTHQIRLHMLHKNNPIVGDQVYGKSQNHNLNALSPSQKSLLTSFSRQALHSSTLKFSHPITLQEMIYEAEMPSDMLELYESLKVN